MLIMDINTQAVYLPDSEMLGYTKGSSLRSLFCIAVHTMSICTGANSVVADKV